ncbi:MAG: Ribosomal large subunit pseudouridine synthase B [Syntrophus sp. SKADARSKE-3]|nr:Ribosomal large subunit pseudouridine synthase B [Syntrophus sp. SKADARSKE-3]
MTERLQKILARAGVASRRAAEELILAGRVSVNGRIVTVLGSQASPADDIRLDGRPVVIESVKRYIMVHKPAGYVTTLNDPQKRPTVLDLIPHVSERVYPVGRLDYDSEGLLIMTNDGDFAYGLQHPRFAVPKTYRVKVAGHVSSAGVKQLAEGIFLNDGMFKPLDVGIEKRTENSTWLCVVIAEGRNRIIRRAMDRMGFPVRRLIRTEIGGIALGNLKTGEFRDLTPMEIGTLAISMKKLS